MKTSNPLIYTISYFLFLSLFVWNSDINAQRNRGVDFDLQAYINNELSKGVKTITVPPGVYRVKPQNREHLNFSNLNNITINMQGVEMICTETTRAITIDKCKNLTIRGLVIDYDPLCYTQGRITRLSPDKKIIEFRLDDNYPDNLVERIEIFDQKTLNLRRSTYYGWEKFVKTGDRIYSISKGDNYRYNPEIDTEEVGDIFVTNNDYTPGGNAPHAIYSDYCENLCLEDFMLYSGNCFGYFETNGKKNQYIRCKIDRRPEETDHYERAKRIRSNDADAFHSKYAFIGPQLIECWARYQGDDGINICGEYYFSVGGKDKNVWLVIPRHCKLEAGNKIEILTFEGEKIEATIKSVQDDGKITEEQIAGILKLEQNAGQKRSLMRPDNKIIKLNIDKNVDFGFGAVAGDSERVGNGFLIQDCNFSYNRSRGILIKASKGKIIGNTLEENWMAAVLISPEVWWLESGSSDDVEVKDNTFIRNKSNRIVNVTGEGFDRKVPGAGLHNNITIENNTFEECLVPVVYVGSTKGGKVISNKVISPVVLSGQSEDKVDFYELVNCKDIKTDF